MSMIDITEKIRAKSAEKARAQAERSNAPLPSNHQEWAKPKTSTSVPFPEILNADELITLESQKQRPPQLVQGLLHSSEKLMLAGASKSFKSWALLDLACSVGTGTPFWDMETTKGRVLCLNYEIRPFFYAERLKRVAKAKGCGPLNNIDVWNLRGHRADFDEVLNEIHRLQQDKSYALIIIDPLYSGLNGKSESDAAEMALFMNGIERIAECGPAVALGHHFAKGNSAIKDSLDRASGSGVFARDPDSIVTLNRHQVQDSFVVEFTLRNFPSLDKIGLKLHFPLLVPDGKVDIELIKGAKPRKKPVTAANIAALIPLAGSMSTRVLFEKAKDDIGIARTKFYELLKEARDAEIIVTDSVSGLNERGVSPSVRK